MTAYALLAVATVNGEYLHLSARAVAVADDETPRNLSTDSEYQPDPMAGIAATAQTDRDPDRTYAYAMRLGLATDSLSVMPTAAVAASLATLRRVESKLARLDARIGPPATYGAWIARIADALGVSVLTGTAGRDGMYATGRYVSWTPGECVSILDDTIARFRRTGSVARDD